jgi:hypothetical protein
MLKTKVGYSQNADSFQSGLETAKMANLGEAKVGLLFTSCVMDQAKIVEGIRSVSDSPVIGCTSSAAICTQDGYLNASTGYSGIMSFGGDVEVVVAGSEKTDNETAREIGRRLAKDAMSRVKGPDVEPDYFFMTASPKEEEEYMKGVQDIIGNIPVFGGSAADNTVEGNWSIICNDKVFTDGCAIAVFFTDSEMKNLYSGQFKETDNVGIITKVVNDRTLVEIDHTPAVSKYCEWTSKDVNKVMGGNLLVETIFNPLGVKDPIGGVVAIRHPMFANNDLSMNIGANLVKNTAIIQMHLEPEEMVEANPKAIKELDSIMNEEAQSYFLVHCGGRRLGLALAGMEDKIYPAVKKVTGDKEFLMVFTFGEYGNGDHSANTVGGLSLSYTGFGK